MQWEQALEAGVPLEEMASAEAHWVQPPLAQLLGCVPLELGHPGQQSSTRGGVGRDPDEDHMREALSRWLAAWRRTPASPRVEYQEWLEWRKGQGRAGAGEDQDPSQETLKRHRRESMRIPEAHTLVQAVKGGDALLRAASKIATGADLQPEVGDGSYRADTEQEKFRFMSAKLSAGTKHGYDTGWKHWVLFTRARSRQPYLLGRTARERHDDEEILLDLIVHLVRIFYRTEGTVKLKLFAVRYHHLIAGLDDPLAMKPRLWLALAGVKRLSGPEKRREPATVEMLE